MRAKTSSKNMNDVQYYEKHDVLQEIIKDPIEMSLETELRESILSGRGKRKLKNISVKMDPLQITALKKIAIMKAIPYQTLIRHWLSEHIKKELHI